MANKETQPMIQPTTTDKIVHAIISSQLALNANEELKKSAPTIFKQSLKNRTNNYLNELIKNEKEFDNIFDNGEAPLKEVYKVMEKFVETISVIPIWEMENFSEVVKAYLKDKSSIEGIVRKVNRS